MIKVWNPVFMVLALAGGSMAAEPVSEVQRSPGAECIEAEVGLARFYITDFGINQWKPDLKLGADFSQAKANVFTELPRQVQILIPMPADRDFQKMNRTDLTRMIFDAVRNRVDKGMKRGITSFEIQLVQNINEKGYFDSRERVGPL
jgi:hypothetical protein